MATHKPFRELIPPGTNFEFIGKQRTWLTVSLIATLATFGMLFVNKHFRGEYLNWSTDFRGGTEIIFGARKAGTQESAPTNLSAVRSSLSQAGFENLEVSEFSLEGADGKKNAGILVRTVDFGALNDKQKAELKTQFVEAFKDKEVLKTTWSGDKLSVRSTAPLDFAAVDKFFTERGHALWPWQDTDAARYTKSQEGSNEYITEFRVKGIEVQYQNAVAKALPGTDIDIHNVYSVGAKAGDKLRNDGIASLFYAMILIMIYLVVRFDIRFAPGAMVATLHDAIIVIGAYAVTYTEFSLTSVAAILTIIGYSVNDTVIIFDRIRENTHKLPDKKFARIMNISINETLSRSILTASTVFVTVLAMMIFSIGSVRNFAFAMTIGVLIGTYSSVFIASPVALWVHNKWYSGPSTRPVAKPATDVSHSEGV